MQPVEKAQPVTREEAKSAVPYPREPLSTTMQPVHDPDPLITESITTVPNEAVATQAVSRKPGAARDAQVVASAPVIHEKQVIKQEQPVLSTHLSGQEQVRVETRALANRPLIEAKLSPLPLEPVSPAENTQPRSNESPGQRKARSLPFINISGSRSSPTNVTSGNLLRVLQGKIDEAMKPGVKFERVKQQQIGGQVFLKFHQEGTKLVLDDLQLYESSGQIKADQQIIKMLRGMFPIDFSEPLVRSHYQLVFPFDIITDH